MLSFLQNVVLSSFTGIETSLSYLRGFPWFGMGEKKRGHMQEWWYLTYE